MQIRPPLRRLIRRCSVILAAVVFIPSVSTNFAQEKSPAAAPLEETQILQHLNNVITWYRNIRTQIQPAGLPSDTIYQGNANRIGADVVSRAFQSAESAIPLLPNELPQTTSNSRQNLVKLLADTTNRDAQLQAQIDQLNSKIASAPRRNRQQLTDQRDRLQGELDLGNSMLNSLNQLMNVSDQRMQRNGDGNQAGTTTFQASIAQLKSSIPELFDKKSQQPAPAAAKTASDPSGLFEKLHRLYVQSLTLRQMDNLVISTNQLQDFVNTMRAPLRAKMRSTIDQGRVLSAQADNPQPGAPEPTKQDFDVLAQKFDQIAAVEVPLSQEILSLNEAKANMTEWRGSIKHEYGALLRDVLVRVSLILGVLGFLLLVSNLWKRISFKYITDTRRRRQLLIVRRFVIGFLMGLVFIFGFVSEFSALATFAGFITAGLAVGLQTILLSVAAYFFLIGRYGLRVGDRISIAGVTGDVIEVGIVRFYLLELAGTGIDLRPTGRVVTFSNSVLFQATSPMFRQLPGASYAWHEIAIELNPSADYTVVEQALMEVIEGVFERYKSVLERLQQDIDERFEIPFTPLTPKTHLQLTDSGLEAIVRYPVSLLHNTETDDEITRKLIGVIATNEKLKASVSGLPKIRAAVRG
ncbi:mechanosensitive ion channel domain-containing protein [Acidobacterium sp. S8]|uniref:mechanosensitive ion channel domain-containing protein n=1 Tax=Acidobacterium sp. S8 TaxID=1641854 RepID=UPI00131B1D41|nr:mechanosensitive ion channel domain-containing protein [Acidobacterium sp. S8]